MSNISASPWSARLRMVAVTTAVALAAGFTQLAWSMPGGGHGGHRGMGDHAEGQGPRHMERLLDKVNASAEQRAQISKITEAAHADMKAQRATMQQLRQQYQAVFAQANVDARAAETVRQQLHAQHDLASKRMLQMKLDISRVLTPAQRATINELMQKRGEMMQRHRSERESLERPRT